MCMTLNTKLWPRNCGFNDIYTLLGADSIPEVLKSIREGHTWKVDELAIRHWTTTEGYINGMNRQSNVYLSVQTLPSNSSNQEINGDA